MRPPAVLFVLLLAACSSSNAAVQGPSGTDTNATVQHVVDRLNADGFPCSVGAAVSQYGSSFTPRPTAYSPAALDCTVGSDLYIVSGYITKDAKQHAYDAFTQRGDTFMVNGPDFLIQGSNKAGVQQAADALNKAK